MGKKAAHKLPCAEDRNGKDDFGNGALVPSWAVCLKDTKEMIGDCGLTLQNIDGETLPEIGYHIRRDCQRKGYAKEAASAVRDWAFENTDHPAIYSYCKYTNVPSYKTAEAIGMQFEKEYPDEANEITRVSVIYRSGQSRFAERLEEAGCKYSKGSIQIPYSDALPLSLISEIAAWRRDTGNHA